MQLKFIAKDPQTDGDDCPTVWVEEEAMELVFQGWKADDELEAKCLETGHIPDSEAVIRIPARMVPIVREACDAIERAELH